MKKEERNKGVTLATLVITIVVLLILSGITINYGVSNIKRAKIQNIKTNMLLIEAKTKEYVENANYDLGIKPNEATAEMKGKAISELEGEGKGTKVTTSSSISTELNIMGITSEEISNGNVYQISTTDLVSLLFVFIPFVLYIFTFEFVISYTTIYHPFFSLDSTPFIPIFSKSV